MVQSRIKALEKSQPLDKLEKIKELEFSFNYKPFNAKTLMTAEDISFSYNINTPIVKNFNLTIRSDDRICVIGKNGRGKTTLLRLLAGDLVPGSGNINTHGNTKAGYFAQTNVINLNNNFSVEEEISAAGCDKQSARNIAGAMMFEGDDALKKISLLSGGEKSRVLLGKILAAPSNLIFLDEPTNHLDMESCDALMLAIDSFPGALVMVTHNEMFLHTLANRFIVFQKSGITVFEGTYADFLARVGWEEEKGDEFTGSEDGKRETLYNKKDLRKLRSDIITRRSKEIKPIEDMIAEIEGLISEKEESLKTKNTEIIRVSEEGKSREIEMLSKEIHSLKKEIDELFEKYESLNISLDEKRVYFESALKKIED
jgi:ATP-binding cassette subfamily F protein 3